MANNIMDAMVAWCRLDHSLFTKRQLVLAMMLWWNRDLLMVMFMLRILLVLWIMRLLLPSLLILRLWLILRLIANLWILEDRHVILKRHCDVPWLGSSDEIPFICVCGRLGTDKVQTLVSWLASVPLAAFTNLHAPNDLW